MTRITWDKVGERYYENGVDHGVLYVAQNGEYPSGVPWNGLTSISENPSGAEATPQYADNIKYLNLVSAEEFGATVNAFTYPPEFGECDGTAEPVPGVFVGQQNRKTFGLAYRTNIGNDVDGQNHGYKLHLVYGALAAPSAKDRNTVNDTPEAIEFSWELSTTPVEMPNDLKPSATLTLDSRFIPSAKLKDLEDILYGTVGTDPRLPLPGEIIAFLAGTTVEAAPAEPAYNATTKTITIPATTGVDYLIDGEVVAAGPVVITADTVVTAKPKSGFKFPKVTDDDWLFEV